MEPGSWTGVSGVWWCMMFVSFMILDFTPAPKHLPGHMLIDRTHIPYTCMNKHNMHAWPYFFTPSSPGLQHPTVLTRSRVSIPRHQRCNSKTKLQGVSTRFSKLFWSTILSYKYKRRWNVQYSIKIVPCTFFLPRNNLDFPSFFANGLCHKVQGRPASGSWMEWTYGENKNPFLNNEILIYTWTGPIPI